MSNTVRKAGTTSPPDNYLFDDSGLPEDIKYLGNSSISGSADQPFIVVADLGRQEYGRAALSSVGTANAFVIKSSPTASASGYVVAGSQSPVGSISFGLRETGGASALVFFVKSTGGKTLSGSVVLGNVI